MRGRERQYELRDLLRAFADAREEAETANRLKDEFLATLSHELRTPLNAILGWTTMLRDGNVQPRHVMRALDTIHRNATAQVQIVNDLLDVSRIVRGNVQLSPRLMSLGPLLTLAVESITPTAEAKGVSISTSLGSTPVFVWADHDRLQQVFWNLLSNAVKFTSSGGRVEVRMETEGGRAGRCRRHRQRHRAVLSSPTSSSGSARPTAARRARTAAWVWGFRSAGTSSSCMAAA